jgi:hypothetical protein
MLKLIQRRLAALDVEAQVVCFDKFLYRVSQLTTAPVFGAVDFATLRRHKRLVALNHGGHLLALVWVNNKSNFVMAHAMHS